MSGREVLTKAYGTATAETVEKIVKAALDDATADLDAWLDAKRQVLSELRADVELMLAADRAAAAEDMKRRMLHAARRAR